MKMKKVLPFLTVAVVATGLVCGTVAANAETGNTEVITGVFDSTSFEKVSYAMDCNQDGIVNVYDMTMLLDFLHCKEDTVPLNVKVNQRIVDSVGTEVNKYLLENCPEMLAFVAEKDIYVDTLSIADIENAFEYSSSVQFPAVVTLKLSKNLMLDEIQNITSFGDTQVQEDFLENIYYELEQENGGEFDGSASTSYDAIRIVLSSQIKKEDLEEKVTGVGVCSVIPVKNRDMTGTVITNTDGRIAAVKQYLGGNAPQVLAMVSDYTVSDDAEQDSEKKTKFSKVTIKFSQPVRYSSFYEICEYSREMKESLSKYIGQYMESNGLDTDENIFVTEFSFTVTTDTETAKSDIFTGYVPTLICK